MSRLAVATASIGVFLSACAQPEPHNAEAVAIEGQASNADPKMGSHVYTTACIACHAPPGLAGAPALGDSAAWSGRAEKGMALLSEHAINGFTGSAGTMPAKGGRIDLTDEEVVAAIEYMLAQLER